jgi:dihydrolipoamide dehydrogenase
MAARMPIEDLAELQFAFPTFTEGVSQAAKKLVRQLGIARTPLIWSSLETTPS